MTQRFAIETVLYTATEKAARLLANPVSVVPEKKAYLWNHTDACSQVIKPMSTALHRVRVGTI